MPAQHRERLLAMIAVDRSWCLEADVYRAGLDDLLPAGLRMPQRYRVDDLDNDHIAEWLEDVRTAPDEWDVPRYRRAARLLGRLAVRLTACDRLPASVWRTPGQLLRGLYFEHEVFALPAVLGDAIGLVLPAVIGLTPALAGLAALGLALLMIGAAITNQRMGRSRDIVVNAVLLGLAAAVTWARFGPYPL